MDLKLKLRKRRKEEVFIKVSYQDRRKNKRRWNLKKLKISINDWRKNVLETLISLRLVYW